MLMLFLVATVFATDATAAMRFECARLDTAKVTTVGANGKIVWLPDAIFSGPGPSGVIITIEPNGDGTERMLLHAGTRLQTEGPSCQMVTMTGDTCPSFVGSGDQVLSGCINDGKVSVVYFDGTIWWVGPEFDSVVPGTLKFVGGFPFYAAYIGSQKTVVWKDRAAPASH